VLHPPQGRTQNMTEDRNPCCLRAVENIASAATPLPPTLKEYQPATRDVVKRDSSSEQSSILALHFKVKKPSMKRRAGTDAEENTIHQERTKRLKIEEDYNLNKLQYEAAMLRRATEMAHLLFACNENHGSDSLLEPKPENKISRSTSNLSFQAKDQHINISWYSSNAFAPQTSLSPFSFEEVNAMADIFLKQPSPQRKVFDLK
jgi:hypothetical protein